MTRRARQRQEENRNETRETPKGAFDYPGLGGTVLAESFKVPFASAPNWVPGIWSGSAAPPAGPTAPPVQPVTALLLGLHHDGRHVAAEVHVSGREVVGGTVLCASRYAHETARAWSACAAARFFHRREYTEAERKANERQGAGVALSDIAHGEAVSIARVGTKSVATRLSLEGLKVVELKVLAEGDALYAWSEAHSWAQRHLLPRERR